VVLLNLSITTDLEDSLVLMDELAGRNPPVPVLVRSLNDGFTDRVEVARSGGRGFIPKTLPPAQLLDAVANVLDQRRTADTKVMAVDDDPEILSILKALLAAEGIEVSELADPLAFWNTLEEMSPDLLILDFDMPHANGAELCQMVRNDPRWGGLPILFLTGHQDPETIRQLFQAGADDYVAKPILGPELVTRVLNRLERTRLLRSAAESDPLTGLANRHKSGQGLLQFLGLAHMHSQPLCLALLDLDDLREINIRHGHAGGDQVLRRLGQFLLGSFRSEDLVGRWDGAEFVVGMYGMTRDDGVQRLAELLESVREEVFWDSDDIQFRVTYSAGVAQYPEDGEDLPSLYRSASEALSQAKAAGGNRVLPAGWQPGQPALTEKVDVVLVDDDETLSSLLLHTLENRGYSTHWLQDGLDAVNALGGQNPSLKAKLVLLDVDLPGMDGLGVLRRLAREGLTQRTRIIMLTLRATEEEVLASLELGAFDHIGKPFSVPVLMQRIKRAIQL
jgi:diguanylate cyclase (GGDEF)-like protein